MNAKIIEDLEKLEKLTLMVLDKLEKHTLKVRASLSWLLRNIRKLIFFIGKPFLVARKY